VCGIVGYLGKKDAVSVLLQGLRTLEYHGYDSVGVAFLNDGSLQVHKKAEKIDALERDLNSKSFHSRLG
jgi:glucosamine--fructose-6-phosphate aminotransferase (isomerizing)